MAGFIGKPDRARENALKYLKPMIGNINKTKCMDNKVKVPSAIPSLSKIRHEGFTKKDGYKAGGLTSIMDVAENMANSVTKSPIKSMLKAATKPMAMNKKPAVKMISIAKITPKGKTDMNKRKFSDGGRVCGDKSGSQAQRLMDSINSYAVRTRDNSNDMKGASASTAKVTYKHGGHCDTKAIGGGTGMRKMVGGGVGMRKAIGGGTGMRKAIGGGTGMRKMVGGGVGMRKAAGGAAKTRLNQIMDGAKPKKGSMKEMI